MSPRGGTLYLPGPVMEALRVIAAERGISRRDAAMLAIGFLQAADAATRQGLAVGAAADREVLDVFIAGAHPRCKQGASA